MNYPNQPNEDPDYIEDIPPLSIRIAAQQIILNAITKAKITGDSYRTQKIICKFKTTGSFDKWINRAAD